MIGEQLGLPVASRESEHFGCFGWLANFLGADMPASSARGRRWAGRLPFRIC
ncbi:hypothetical protein [Sodalis glossinidius]|uniref:hypothetical protein n=1 Tax=Sodalis glossinidius TaxID=63612 RepID=UPI001FB095C6|nr:hypothetical protein [Sodalis glossinidius]